jgi:hypothetical protein
MVGIGSIASRLDVYASASAGCDTGHCDLPQVSSPYMKGSRNGFDKSDLVSAKALFERKWGHRLSVRRAGRRGLLRYGAAMFACKRSRSFIRVANVFF